MDRKYEQLTPEDAFILSRIMRNYKLAKRLLEPLIGYKIKKIIYTPNNIVKTEEGLAGVRLEVHFFDGKSRVVLLQLFVSMEDLFGAGRSVYRFKEQCMEEPGIRLDKELMQIFVCATPETAEKEENEDIRNFLYYLINPAERKNSIAKILNDELRRIHSNSLYKKEYRDYIQEETENSQRLYAQSHLPEKKR